MSTDSGDNSKVIQLVLDTQRELFPDRTPTEACCYMLMTAIAADTRLDAIAVEHAMEDIVELLAMLAWAADGYPDDEEDTPQ